MGHTTAWLLATWLQAHLAFGFSVQKNTTAGETVSLSCQVANVTDITVVEWKRPEMEDEYVLLFRDEQCDPEEQHPSFKNRVDLLDRRRKGGDVSLILKDVTMADSGTYECHIFIRGVVMDGRPVCTISLSVGPSGQPGAVREDGSIGLIVGLSVFSGLLIAVGAGIYRIYWKKRGQTSYELPFEQQEKMGESCCCRVISSYPMTDDLRSNSRQQPSAMC